MRQGGKGERGRDVLQGGVDSGGSLGNYNTGVRGENSNPALVPSPTLHKKSKHLCGGAATVLTEEIPGMELHVPPERGSPQAHNRQVSVPDSPSGLHDGRSSHTPVLPRSLNWPIPRVLSTGTEYRTVSHTQHCQSAFYQLDRVQTDRHLASLFSDPWCLRAQGLWKRIASTFLKHSFHLGGIQS